MADEREEHRDAFSATDDPGNIYDTLEQMELRALDEADRAYNEPHDPTRRLKTPKENNLLSPQDYEFRAANARVLRQVCDKIGDTNSAFRNEVHSVIDAGRETVRRIDDPNPNKKHVFSSFYEDNLRDRDEKKALETKLLGVKKELKKSERLLKRREKRQEKRNIQGGEDPETAQLREKIEELRQRREEITERKGELHHGTKKWTEGKIEALVKRVKTETDPDKAIAYREEIAALELKRRQIENKTYDGEVHDGTRWFHNAAKCALWKFPGESAEFLLRSGKNILGVGGGLFSFVVHEIGGDVGIALMQGMIDGLMSTSTDQNMTQPIFNEEGKVVGQELKSPKNIFRDEMLSEFSVPVVKKMDKRIQRLISDNIDHYGDKIVNNIDLLYPDGFNQHDQRFIAAGSLGKLLGREIKTMDDLGNVTVKHRDPETGKVRGFEYDLTNLEDMGRLFQALLPRELLEGKSRDVELENSRKTVKNMFEQSGISPDEFLDIIGKGQKVKIDEVILSANRESTLSMAEFITIRNLEEAQRKLRGITDEQISDFCSRNLDIELKIERSGSGHMVLSAQKDGEEVDLTLQQMDSISDRIQRAVSGATMAQIKNKVDGSVISDEIPAANLASNAVVSLLSSKPEETFFFDRDTGKMMVSLRNEAKDITTIHNVDNYLKKPEFLARLEAIDNFPTSELYYQAFKNVAKKLGKTGLKEEFMQQLVEQIGVESLPPRIDDLPPEAKSAFERLAETVREKETHDRQTAADARGDREDLKKAMEGEAGRSAVEGLRSAFDSKDFDPNAPRPPKEPDSGKDKGNDSPDDPERNSGRNR